MTVIKKELCPFIRLSKDEIALGDTVSVEVFGMDQYGNLIPYSPNQLFNISIISDTTAGTLVSTQANEHGADLINVPSPALFISNRTIGADSMEVDIKAWLGSNSGGSSSSSTMSNQSLHISKSIKEISPRNLTVDQFIQLSSTLNQGAAYRLLKGKLKEITNNKSSRQVDHTAVNKIQIALSSPDLGGICQLLLSFWVKEPKLEIKADADEYFITSEPRMPQMRLTAIARNTKSNATIKYTWKMTIKWVDDFHTTWTTEKPLTREVTLQSPVDLWIVEWKDESNNNIFVGGDDITIEATATIDGEEYKAKPIVDQFSILGNNPDPAVAYSGFNDFEKKIMKHESLYRQFWVENELDKFRVPTTPHYPKVGCNWGKKPSADYGIMQVNSGNYVTLEEVWNWQKNKAHGIILMYDAEDYAEKWPAAIRANKFDKRQEVDVSADIYRQCPDFKADEVEQLWKETYARYNGGSKKTHYWMWFPKREDDPNSVPEWKEDSNNTDAATYADDTWDEDVP